MNPLTWKWQHLVTLALLILLGGVTSMVFGSFFLPFSHSEGAETTVMFFARLHYPLAYWPCVASGAVTAGMTFYLADLPTGAR
jgi:hypothetical protein